MRSVLVLVVVLSAGEARAEKPFRALAQRVAERFRSKRADAPRPSVVLNRPYRPGRARLGDGPIVTIQGVPLLGAGEYHQLRDAVKPLLRAYPPSKSYYIGLGRDPAAIIAFLQNLGGRQLAMTLPVSGSGLWQRAASHPPWLLIRSYLAELIPHDVATGDRDIVLVDQTGSGRTLAGFPPYVQRYLDEVGFRGRLVKVAFSPNAQAPDVHRIDTTPFPSLATFATAREGVISEYPRHIIGMDAKSELAPRHEYTQFRRALAGRMGRDADLDSFLVDLQLHGSRPRH